VFWSLRFAEPIVLADGFKLATLRDAIAHLGKAIPKSDHDMPAVPTAAELLTNAAEHRGPVEFARIGTLQAINRHVRRVFNPDRKETMGAQKAGARPMTGGYIPTASPRDVADYFGNFGLRSAH
jgi:hypothetical protein